ncbi:hypothetical protein [Metabacillus litoralis]|jgi:hypothetical protein|uniref:hypothetical protein n=1 Tax=Metabacillus litoralis TaxID=152268 RepID=UPI00203FA944|nr:hypothetical protein [Metabacillus litoralis]MCM3650998.1 hypothetical protein [Metabacillus litoralis]
MFLLFDFMLDFLIGLYVSLGFGTDEYKINVKIEKLAKDYPEVLDYYQKYQPFFEKDKELSEALLRLNLKDSANTKYVVDLIHIKISRFELV